jgi:lysophospholipase L1-like esterase
MKRSLIFTGLFLIGVAFSHAAEPIDIEKLDANMTLEQADESGVAWFDPREAPFRLNGFKWIGEEKVYRRLPLKPAASLPESVDHLANHTAGGQIQFQSDATKLLIKVKLRQVSGMYHMPATGQSGFDLYIGEPGAQQYYKTSRFGTGAKDYTVTLFEGSKTNRHFTLNFPLYNGVQSVQVGVAAGSTVRPPLPFKEQGSIVVYGTSITQGGCASRPGMAYSNILSRRLNREFVNLGFSGSGRGEPALAEAINLIADKRMIILDYEANAGSTLMETLPLFIKMLREADKDIPILVASKIHYATDLFHANNLAVRRNRTAAQKALVDERRAAGDNNIYFLDGENLLGKHAHECTVDGVHPNDLGFLNIADGFEPVIRKILGLPSAPTIR